MSPRRQRTFALLLCALLGIWAAGWGCAPLRLKTRAGVYHKVQKGETLWRICYTYRVNMQTVCRFNGIKDPERIDVGQEIFIPGAKAVLRVEPARPKTAAPVEHRPQDPLPPSKAERKGKSPDRELASKAPAPQPDGRPARLEFIWPVKGPVTTWFGVQQGRRHDGIDIVAPKGTPVRAAERGKVIYSDDGMSGYGNLVILQHEGGFHTVYAHNSRNLVDVDEVVNKSQVIAEVGDTGRATGNHLHFEIRKNRRAVDPMQYLP